MSSGAAAVVRWPRGWYVTAAVGRPTADPSTDRGSSEHVERRMVQTQTEPLSRKNELDVTSTRRRPAFSGSRWHRSRPGSRIRLASKSCIYPNAGPGFTPGSSCSTSPWAPHHTPRPPDRPGRKPQNRNRGGKTRADRRDPHAHTHNQDHQADGELPELRSGGSGLRQPLVPGQGALNPSMRRSRRRRRHPESQGDLHLGRCR